MSGSSRNRLSRERVYTDGSGARRTAPARCHDTDGGPWHMVPGGGDGHPSTAPG